MQKEFCRKEVAHVIISSVQLLSRVRLFATPGIAACQASLSITNSRSLLKLMSIELVMPSSHLTLCHPLLLLPPIPPSYGGQQIQNLIVGRQPGDSGWVMVQTKSEGSLVENSLSL